MFGFPELSSITAGLNLRGRGASNKAKDPRKRLQQIEMSMAQNPGRAINGTGNTGLNPMDAHGYSDMLNEQQEYLALKAMLSKKAGPTIEYGGELPSTRQSSIATGRNNAAAFSEPLAAHVGGEDIEAVMAALQKKRRR